MKVKIRKSAIKDLKKLTNNIQNRIHNGILTLENFPDISNWKKLTHFEPAYRLRVGDYRILFDNTADEIFIGRILHRTKSYK